MNQALLNSLSELPHTTSLQLCLLRREEEILNQVWPPAEPGATPLRPDSLMLWLSAGKPVTAIAIMILVERGLLELDDPIAAHLPEFHHGGKAAITFRHILAHTAGLHGALDYSASISREAALHQIRSYELPHDWRPGARCAYDPAAGWQLLGEVIERLTGSPYGEFVRDEIFLPLGMPDCWAGLPADEYQAYAATNRLAGLGPPAGAPPAPPTAEACARFRPGSNTRGPASQMTRLMQMLGNAGAGPAGTRILSPQSVAAMRTQQHTLRDETFNFNMRWGLGLILNAANAGRKIVMYGYGPTAGPDTFGHGGAQCASLFYDPAHALAGAIAFNTQPGEVPHQRRMHALFAAIYAELGLAS